MATDPSEPSGCSPMALVMQMRAALTKLRQWLTDSKTMVLPQARREDSNGYA